MQLTPEEVKPSVTRLKRAKGQLEAVIRMLEEGQECEDAVMQLSAVAKAIDRAGYLIVSTGMKKCFTSEGSELDEKKLERMFLSLA
ncbi:MAG: metal-sensitive transcriptional regulator [Corynebacterium humireducens]|jgi:DNA-binding FrmR family transcriptional regulator|uniref:Copper-sensing transcriptional repressor CsoR n=2 Tax=Corynebacterium humireducens TaxID=1223514 RepID=A0A0B5D8M0_9CORY|nr:metal-sensitive transcriptional regulator [Corynebacterium humireducens]AJE32124.1 copper-sensing transcriptional repressor CsoR [Corynebacterium humireducens NBRC 106098 = DSM 45392]NLA55182.1 metal-sensitive transcriptional regulator [Corynebacterium humireducens]